MEKTTEEYLQEKFPELWKYVAPLETTDVDYNCGNLWLTTTHEATHKVIDEAITEEYMRNVASSIALHRGRKFNEIDNRLCVDTEELRITSIHHSVSCNHVSVCIRKEVAALRYTMEEAINQGLCDKDTFFLLKNCVLAQYNFTFCGIPGTGKTEALKKFSSYIPLADKVVTIEDVGEIHYAAINPEHNCIELKVGREGYGQCITDALRLNPVWILFGEALGKNTQYLLESWSNGVATMSTLHVNDARNIPDKIVNSLAIRQDTERITNQLHNDIGIAVLFKRRVLEGDTVQRYIDQVCFYFRKDKKNGQALVVEDGKLYKERIPEFVLKKIESAIGRNFYLADVGKDFIHE